MALRCSCSPRRRWAHSVGELRPIQRSPLAQGAPRYGLGATGTRDLPFTHGRGKSAHCPSRYELVSRSDLRSVPGAGATPPPLRQRTVWRRTADVGYRSRTGRQPVSDTDGRTAGRPCTEIIEMPMAVLQKLRGDDGLSILLVEQHARLALTLAVQAIVLDCGRIVYQGPSSTLLKDSERMQSLLGVVG